MRVISGQARGIKLVTVDGLETRPTTDRVKEAIFSMIQHSIYDVKALDLFSGSGALGIELLSRGGNFVDFVELNKAAITCINENLTKTKLGEFAKVHQATVENALLKLNQSGAKYDVVFMDPPYHKGHIKSTIDGIINYKLLNINGIIVLEHHIDDMDARIEIEALELVTLKKYGIIGVSIYRRIK